ncbi:arsenate reductase ArsC [Nocardia panacis]|uniref:Arsenate reductase ArsC n=1 Tax=Nocardia panacis TaxID=2340916 RepID=A0A3A4KQ98_9NOCA|nr:arsenate reductase ArsC [Nocardia panacis]RJO75190.1 arsenate reductase ArsC [Nocardia panacis]
MAHTPSVLFVCVHDASRSPMAAGLLTALAGTRIEVRTAGSAPAATINPSAVAAMAELGIDICAHRPKALTDEAVGVSDVVVTMGPGDGCPYFPGISYRHWDLPDPAGYGLEGIRPIRDRLRILVENLIAELVPTPTR